MASFRLLKQGGDYVLEGAGTPATLSTGFSMRRGTVRAGDRSLPIETNNPWRSGVTLGDLAAPPLRLDPSQSWVPGEAGPRPVRWETGRSRGGYSGTLTGDAGVIDLSLSKRRSATPEITVT